MTARRGKLVPLSDDIVAYTYARVSSDDQEKDGMSLPVQDKETLAEVARHPGWTFGGAFKDVQTGTNPTRTDYQRMLTAARVATAAGKRVMIVVVRQNRFGRDGEEALRAWKEFERLSAELWATRDGGHLADPLMYGVRAILAEHDVRQISENVKETFAEIRANGWLKPGRPRWGYRWQEATPEQRQLQGSPMVVPVPHPDEAPYVRELFRRRAAGESVTSLAAWAKALPESARGSVRQQDGTRRGRQLDVSAVRETLSAPAYAARNPQPGVDLLDVPPGKWEPLCDDATWRAIHPRAGERENPVRVSSRNEYVLTGYLFCEVCGARMCGQIRRGGVRLRPGRRPYDQPDRRVYICSSRMAGASWTGPTCHRTIDADLIEFEVFRTFGPLLAALARPGLREAARQAARDAERRTSATGDARRLLNYEQDRKALIEERDALTIAVSLNRIPQEAYMSAVASVAAKLAPLDAEIERLRAQRATTRRREDERPMVDVLLEQAGHWQWVVEEGGVSERRAFLKLVLDRATPRRVRHGEYRAGMQLTALGNSLLEVGAATLPIGGGRVEDVQRAWANCLTATRPDAEQRASA
jgi:DNA invertase Pin-like site-specific DNA recombinase/uncharacterized small protein (DUF1192 family)